ncbi:MAG TPA: chromate transporter [Fervidobacterium sp.]|jgi:chromate transporter|nr:chromate transporter [Fervidobacterium sp.]HQG02153.1 chromate transporter [Fervidobacterium sp.]HQI09731.1 chromate transporter [Fervidobacterium sp.]
MSTYIELFLTFLQIGAVSFGGGYSILKSISHYVVDVNKWITLDEFNDIVAISQSTPGPIGINAATYVGYKVAGVFGSLLATFSVVLIPITLSIIMYWLYRRHSENEIVKSTIQKLRPVIVAMIASASLGFLQDSFGSIPGIIITIISALVLLFTKVGILPLMLISGVIGIFVFR